MTINSGLSINYGSSWEKEYFQLGPLLFFSWSGYGILPASSGTAVASVPLVIPSRNKIQTDLSSLAVPANHYITRLYMVPDSIITCTTATGAMKLAPTLANTGAPLQVASAAAASNALSVANGTAANNSPFNTASTTVGSSAVTYSLFAVQGTGALTTADSFKSAGTSTRIDAEVSGYTFADNRASGFAGVSLNNT